MEAGGYEMTLMIHYGMAGLMTLMAPVLLAVMARGFRQDAVDSPDYEGGCAAYHAALRRLVPLSAIAFVGLMIAITLLRGALSASPPRGAAHPLLSAIEIAIFHLLWWPFAAPVVNAAGRMRADGRTIEPAGSGSIRTASLRPRRVSDDLPGLARAAPFALAGLGVGAIAWRAGQLGALGFPTTLLGASGVVIVIVYSVWMRQETDAPQPLVGDDGAARAYHAELEANRRFRVRSILGLQLAFAFTMFACGYGALEVQAGRLSGRTVGLIGAVAGSAVGLIGGWFGVCGSLRTQRLQALRARLDEGAGSRR